MIGNSFPAYLLIRLADWGLSLLAPALISGVAFARYYEIHIPWILEPWTAGEVVFFFWFLWRKRNAQKVIPFVECFCLFLFIFVYFCLFSFILVFYCIFIVYLYLFLFYFILFYFILFLYYFIFILLLETSKPAFAQR
jgi:hypothetical protein